MFDACSDMLHAAQDSVVPEVGIQVGRNGRVAEEDRDRLGIEL